MTTLRSILHQELLNSRENPEPYRINGLTFERLNSDLCDDVFLIGSRDVREAIEAIEHENIHRQEMRTPLEQNFNFTLEGSTDTGPITYIVQFDLEAVRAACRKQRERDRSDSSLEVVFVDNMDRETNLSSRMMIYDSETDTGMMFSVLEGMNGYETITDVRKYVAG